MGFRDLFNRERDESPTVGTAVGPFSKSGSPAPVTVERSAEGSWIPAGGTIVVDGRSIPGGMVYFGTDLHGIREAEYAFSSWYQPSPEPALIDPSLRVEWASPDYAGTSMGYWPSYSEISPHSRAAYLAWLADGRRSPGTYIGYVFLFLYGLERRLLVDLESDLDGDEATALFGEVERLLGLYGDNGSFRGYASNLLSFATLAKSISGELTPPVWTEDHRGWEMPIDVQLGVSRYVAAGQPIPTDWALAYLRFHPSAYLNTPAKRCQSEFDELFRIRYRARFGDGLKVRAPSTKLQFSYRPSSASFGRTVNVQVGGLPDVMSIEGPINKLRDLATEISDELDAYSRLLGRRPDEAGTPAAIALLPDELVATHGGELVDQLRLWVDERLAGQQQAVVPLDELVDLWSSGKADKLAKRDAVALASLLGKFDIGIEPDVRFGASTPKPGSDVVLFRITGDSAVSPSSSYTAAMSLVHLTAVVAAADGSITGAEIEHLADHANQVLGLDESERTRLEAHLSFLATGKLGMAGMKRRVENLPATERAAVGRFLIDVAAADGVVSPDEISTLTKLFGHLGLDETDLYRQIHSLGTGDPGPVTVDPGEQTTRWAVPPATADEHLSERVVLDPAKVQARLAETAQVAALLTNIFADDNISPTLPPPTGLATRLPPPGSPAAQPPPDSASIAGLDAAHSAFAVQLSSQTTWDRGEAEGLAESLGLTFLDAAMDTINEAAFEICGEPLLEGDDPVELNAYAIEEMIS